MKEEKKCREKNGIGHLSILYMKLSRKFLCNL